MQEMILAKVVVHKDLLIKLIKILFFARPSDEGGALTPFSKYGFELHLPTINYI